MTNLNIPHLNKKFETATTIDILQWAWDTFGSAAAASSSFQTQSVPLLHMISLVCPEMPVIFLDTGFHFPETLKFRDELQTRLTLNIIVAHPDISKIQFNAQYGQGLYRQDPDLCCYINKVEPMQRTLKDFDAWVSGVRRDQTSDRKNLSVLEAQSTGSVGKQTGPLKIYPMLNWTRQEIFSYINQHNLPVHPLFDKGYPSIGCAPCTRPTAASDGERSGRWAGIEKDECGLHLDLSQLQEETVK